ncbi:hypothetical protein AOQ84DRAFT_402078, partial [Glonium stellatum]
MHKKLSLVLSKLESLDVLLLDMKEKMAAFQSMHLSAELDTNQRLSDLQFSGIMDALSKASLPDPMKSYRYCLFMQKKRHLKSQSKRRSSLQSSPKLKFWFSAANSKLSIVEGSYCPRFEVKDFSVDMVERLRESGVPVIWALKATKSSATLQHLASPLDILKSLILQSLHLNSAIHTEKAMGLSCARVQTASTG